MDLNTKHVDDAFQLLNINDIVIGPAKDGGYYLLGMKSPHLKVFKNKAWGTSTVFKETLKDIKNSTYSLMQELNDIDTFEDIKPYQQLRKFYNTND